MLPSLKPIGKSNVCIHFIYLNQIFYPLTVPVYRSQGVSILDFQDLYFYFYVLLMGAFFISPTSVSDPH
jgi:hypothetical protein